MDALKLAGAGLIPKPHLTSRAFIVFNRHAPIPLFFSPITWALGIGRYWVPVQYQRWGLALKTLTQVARKLHTQWLETRPHKTQTWDRLEVFDSWTAFFFFLTVTWSDELNLILFLMHRCHYPCAIFTTICNTVHVVNSIDIAVLCSDWLVCSRWTHITTIRDHHKEPGSMLNDKTWASYSAVYFVRTLCFTLFFYTLFLFSSQLSSTNLRCSFSGSKMRRGWLIMHRTLAPWIHQVCLDNVACLLRFCSFLHATSYSTRNVSEAKHCALLTWILVLLPSGWGGNAVKLCHFWLFCLLYLLCAAAYSPNMNLRFVAMT